MLNSPSSVTSGYVDFESNSVFHSWSLMVLCHPVLFKQEKEGAACPGVSMGPGVGAVQAAVLALSV